MQTVDVTVAGDGSRLALHRVNGSDEGIWVSDGSGGALQRVATGSFQLIGFSADASAILVQQLAGTAAVVAIPVGGGAARPVFSTPDRIQITRLSPDRRKLLVETLDASFTATARIVDVASAAAVIIPDSGTMGFQWAPDSHSLAAIDLRAASVGIYNADGSPVRIVPLDGQGQVIQVTWGDDSSELFVSSGPNPDFCSSDAECAQDAVLRRLAAASGTLQEMVRLPAHTFRHSEFSSGSELQFIRVPGRSQLLAVETDPNAPAGSDGFKWVTVSTQPPYAQKALAGSDPDLQAMIQEAIFDAANSSTEDVPVGFGAFGRMFFYSEQWTPEMGGTCTPFHEDDFWTFRTLQNLTADLNVVRGTSFLKLTGTATDAHFAKYALDYATTDAPDTWIPVAPVSTVAVIGGDLAQWPRLRPAHIRCALP